MNPDAFLRQAREFEEESSNSWIGRQVLRVFIICGASVRERASEFKSRSVGEDLDPSYFTSWLGPVL